MLAWLDERFQIQHNVYAVRKPHQQDFHFNTGEPRGFLPFDHFSETSITTSMWESFHDSSSKIWKGIKECTLLIGVTMRLLRVHWDTVTISKPFVCTPSTIKTAALVLIR